MIDIHSHILPGIDDGSKSMDVSLKMARTAVEDGIKVIIATPHGMDEDLAPMIQARDAALENLRRELEAQGVQLKLLPGMECYMNDKLFDQIVRTPSAAMNYRDDDELNVLMELPMDMDLTFLPELLFRAQMKRIQLILAHPERYDGFVKHVKLLKELMDKGMYLQLNSTSLKTAWWQFAYNGALRELFRHCPEQIFLASDAHNNGSRPPVLSSVKEKVTEWIGEEGWKLATEENALRLFGIDKE